MSIRSFALIIAVGTSLVMAPPAPADEPVRRQLEGPSSKLILADAGKTEYSIVVHPRASAPERHAARELATFLSRISGAEFPVREVEHVDEGSTVIRVGPDAAAGIISEQEMTSLGKEGYIVRSQGNTLVIAGGRPRGTLYGVYSLLDEKLGCRWFTPDVERIPSLERIELARTEVRFVPALEYRATDYPNSTDGDWAARNRMNGHNAQLNESQGGRIAYGPFVHTFNMILNPDEHFARHPEYFSEVNGRRIGGHTQLCVSNPEVLRISIDTVRRWMREQPEATIFSVSQNDWYNFCTCGDCRAIIKEEGSPAGAYLRYVNAIADAVRDEFPDKAISTLAYQFTRRPPSKTVPRPNVIVRLCDIECCFSHPLVSRGELDPRNSAFAADLRRWSEISDRLYIWDYAINYAHSIMPFPNLYTLKPNIDFFLKHGVRGIYEEANYFSRGGEFAELRTWIIAKTLWDPSYDTDRAIDEFLDGYYERAAVPLRRYIDLVHGQVRRDGAHFHIFDPPTTPVFSEELVARAEALFDEAMQSVADRPSVLHRVQVARLPITYVKIARLVEKAGSGAGLTQDERGSLKTMFDEFQRVAAAAEVTHISEGLGFGNWVASVKSVLGEDK